MLRINWSSEIFPTSSVQRVSCIKHFANVSVNTNITYTMKPAWFLWFSDIALNMKYWTFMLVLAQFSLFGDRRIEMWLKQAEDSSVLWYMLDTCLLFAAIYCLLVSFDIFFLFLLCFTQLPLYFVCFWCMFLFSGVSLSCRAFELLQPLYKKPFPHVWNRLSFLYSLSVDSWLRKPFLSSKTFLAKCKWCWCNANNISRGRCLVSLVRSDLRPLLL